MKNILTKSDKFTSEYCCTCVRVGEIKPITGKDKIGYTLINGESIVIRKDLVKEGDMLIYASNETQLNKDFLSVNNLFESSSFELNTNSKEVEPYINKSKELKIRANDIEKEIAEINKYYNILYNFDADILSCENDDEVNGVKFRHEYARDRLCRYLDITFNCDSPLSMTELMLKTTERIIYKTQELEDIKKEIEKCNDFIKSHVGFFNKTGRVRTIRLGGIQSMGYLFSIEELAKYNPKVRDINLNDMIGEDFDTVDGELFVKAYVPFVPQSQKIRDRTKHRNQKIERFDRMVKGEFSFHYDTQQFPRYVTLFNPSDTVVIDVKCHGTSFICGKLHVKTPIKLPFYKKIWNKLVDFTKVFKKYHITDYMIEYGNVTSSRTVIKNQYINKNVDSGYYNVDVWSEYGEIIYPYLDEGMIVYGEICGYVTNSDKMIQKGYDYGCERGKNFLMPYRITTTREDGTKKEWDVQEVYEWTVKLLNEHSELTDKIHPLTILYHGTLAELYPDLSLTEHWHENLLERMRNDKSLFGLEKNEPLCKNKVPREGICIRKNGDDIPECFKLKSMTFLRNEAKLMDEVSKGKEELSEEMIETYAQ